MQANASSSSATNPSTESSANDEHRLALELVTSGRLPALPTHFYSGEHRDLLEPLTLLEPGTLPIQATQPTQAPTISSTERAAVAKALGDLNGELGHPQSSELAAKLADPTTRVIVTGQQPGLLGGPLMALDKMIAALRFAQALEDQGTPAVAIFWVATEDHDWSEVAQTTLLSKDGAETLTLGDDASPLQPVGPRRIGDAIDPIAERMRELLRGDEASARLEQALAIYSADSTLGEAFMRLMLRILGDRAPLFLDALDPRIKRLQAPLMRRLVEQRSALGDDYADAHAALEARDLPLQVTPQPGVSPLFLLHDGARRRIEWRGDDAFSLRGLDDFEAPVADLLDILDREPERISPGVLARPAVQDALLGTTLQVMGPSELSYMTQARAAYSFVGADSVQTTMRPQVMVVEARHAEWLQELDVSLDELMDSSIDEIIHNHLGEDLVTPAREQVNQVLAELEQRVLEIDQTLERPFDKTRQQIDRGLDALSGKISSAVARRHEVWTRRLTQVRGALLPNGQPQERVVATAFLWARHGDALVDALFEQIDLDPRRQSVVLLS